MLKRGVGFDFPHSHPAPQQPDHHEFGDPDYNSTNKIKKFEKKP
jgi:hypothetical protein